MNQVCCIPSRRLIGSLLHLTYTRPDFPYSVSILSQFSSAPRQSHWQAAIRVLRYLANHSTTVSRLEAAWSLLATRMLIGQVILILEGPHIAIVLC